MFVWEGHCLSKAVLGDKGSVEGAPLHRQPQQPEQLTTTMGALMLLIATLVWGVLATTTEGPDTQVCGKPKNSPQPLQRIIGGRMSGKGLFPWQGRLVSPHNLTAGATLISDQWVLTTARNVYLGQNASADPEDIAPTLKLFLGNRGRLPAGAVERVVLHPNFNATSDRNATSKCHPPPGIGTDLALLKLQHPVPLGPEVLPICLPHKDFLEVGRVGYVAGWGRGITLAFAKWLRYIMVPVADANLCAKYYADGGPLGVAPDLGPDSFCVGMSELQEDTCHGDAGGAFAVHDPDDDTWYAAGILTYDRTCSAAKYSVYASVRHALAWIHQTMDESKPTPPPGITQ